MKNCPCSKCHKMQGYVKAVKKQALQRILTLLCVYNPSKSISVTPIWLCKHNINIIIKITLTVVR